jgi:MSHA biogenesis protein MshL
LLDAQGPRVLSAARVDAAQPEAIIKAGTDEFFVTGCRVTPPRASTTTSLDVELTPFFSGVALDVTPQISDDGTVLMHIHPTVSDVQDQSKRISFGGSAAICRWR